jgi:hypothetical protein
MAVCYDGDAFGRLLTMAGAPADERARATLSLSRRGCLDPAATPDQRRAFNEARLALLAEASPANPTFFRLSPAVAHRLRLRTAEALAEQAHDRAMHNAPDAAAASAAEALRLLALVDRGQLPPEDRATAEDTAVRVGAVRWLAEPPEPAARRPRFRVDVAAGRPGESCVRLQAAATEGASTARPLAERCTFGVVFTSSLRVAASGRVVTLAVAPVSGWTELWVFRAAPDGTAWRGDVIPPATGEPGSDIGYVEAAGFSPDGVRLLVARAFRVGGNLGRRFEVLAPNSVVVERWASSPQRLGGFQRWASPAWQKTTLAAR